MTKIMFVDDDAIARRNIVTKINWEEHGWELIYTAKDAVDALDYMKQNQPDIIISDIKMPVMDGIQMALVARNYYPDIKYIFLSGYKEFEYAKQAIKLNAVDYLNKPVEAAQLIEVLKEADHLSREARRANDILKEKYPFIKRHYLSRLMYQHFREVDDSVFKAFDINLSNGFGISGFIDFETGPAKATCLQDTAGKLSSSLSAKFSGSFFMNIEDRQVFFIFTCCNLKSEEEFWEKVREMETYTKNCAESSSAVCHPVFHYGAVIKSLNDLYLSYESILQSIQDDTSDLLAKVKAYLDENYYREDLTLTQIAEHFYVNHCYLTSIFKEKYGINLYDYLIQTRMKKAGELVENTDKKVYEIAEAVGYKNSQYFSVSFKKYFSCTVLEYKKRRGRG